MNYVYNNGSVGGFITNYNDNDFSINAIASYGKGDGLEPIATDSKNTTHSVETLREEKSFLTNIKYKNHICISVCQKFK